MDSTSPHPRRRLRFSIRALLLLITACTIAAYWLRPPIVLADVEYLGIENNAFEPSDFNCKFRLINRSTDPIWYFGFPGDPIARCETYQNGQWEDVSEIGCGDVKEDYNELKPNETVEIWGSFYLAGPVIRAGVDLSPYRSGERPITVWSDPVKWTAP